MSEEYITKEIIIEEFLNNWFTYQELADYLCISLEEVKKTLDICIELDEKVSKKVANHKGNIDLYYTNPDMHTEPINDVEETTLLIAKYIIETHNSIRKTAEAFELGKTTVHEYIHTVLPKLSISLYKGVFDVLMSNKSFSTKNKKVIEQVLTSYNLLLAGFSSEEIWKKQSLSRNIVERNLTTRLQKIDKEKYLNAKQILLENRMEPLKQNEYKPRTK